jgi:hypothetical protein
MSIRTARIAAVLGECSQQQATDTNASDPLVPMGEGGGELNKERRQL